MASQKGMSKVQIDNGLNTWAKQGSGKTDFESSVQIIDAQGNEISVDHTSPMPIWDAIPPNCKIKYRVKTISKGKGKSDRCQLDIQYTDYSAVMRVLERVKRNLTEDQLQRYEAGSVLMEDTVNKMVATIIIDEKIPLTKTIFSKTLNTNDEGIAEGEIDISSWPYSEYNIMFQYGYRGDEEGRTAWGNTWENVAVVGATVGFLALSFVPGVGWAAQAALLAVEIAAFTAYEMMKTYGISSENKYGVTFPEFGFMHPYAFGSYGQTVADESQGMLGSLTTELSGVKPETLKIVGGITLLAILLRRLI